MSLDENNESEKSVKLNNNIILKTNESAESNVSSNNNNNLPIYNNSSLLWRKNLSLSFNENNYVQAYSFFNQNKNNNSNNNSNSNNNNNNINFLNNNNNNSNIITNLLKNNSKEFTKNTNEKQLIDIDEIISGKNPKTTLMIRNIPIKYTDEMLIKELRSFENKFDCIYMPYDFENSGNKGYAFINFVHPFHILLFYDKFQGKSWEHFESKKICELNFANFQGINEIKKHANNYKGRKKPNYFNVNENKNGNIEIPKKYLKKMLKVYPNLKYIEKSKTKTIKIIEF